MCSEEQDMSVQPPPSIEELDNMMWATQEPTKYNKMISQLTEGGRAFPFTQWIATVLKSSWSPQFQIGPLFPKKMQGDMNSSSHI